MNADPKQTTVESPQFLRPKLEMRLRWRVPPHTTTDRPVLEQAWEAWNGATVWVPVPTEVS